jgi:hypothetical protein
MHRRMSCTAGSAVKLQLELERLYERRSLLSTAIGALERWKQSKHLEKPPDRADNSHDPSNLSKCRHA